MLATVATVTLAADYSPQRSEGFSFALMMSIINLSTSLPGNFGSFLFEHVFHDSLTLLILSRRPSPPSPLCSFRSCISATSARGIRSRRRPARRELHCAPHAPRRHRHRKHKPLRIARASGAQSRTGRRARRNAVVNYNRRAASDLRAFAIAQVTLAPPLDFDEFGVANGFESVFVNSDVLDDILIRTMIEAPPSTTAPMANSGWKGTPTLRTRIKSSGIERRSDLRCDSNSTARQREDRRLLLLVSGKRNGKAPAGFGAVHKWHGVFLSW